MIKYYTLTILRNGKYETVAFSSDTCKNPQRFLIMELSLGHETYIINSIEITEDEFTDLYMILLKK